MRTYGWHFLALLFFIPCQRKWINLVVIWLIPWSGANAYEVKAELFEQAGIEMPRQRVLAPDFELFDLYQSKMSLAQFKNKVVIVNFWATWCVPCRDELIVLQQLWRQYEKQGLVILAVAIDQGRKESIIKYIDRIGVNYPVLWDKQGIVHKQYEMVGVPTTYLVARDAKISGRVIGAIPWDTEAIHALISYMLAETSL